MLACIAQLPADTSGAYASATLIYGWMPTIPKSLDAGVLRDLIATARSDYWESLALPDESPVNNSWVGLSKILHFAAPDRFPIWDSRIARHFGVKYHYQMKNRDAYVCYIKKMRAAVLQNDPIPDLAKLKSQMGDFITDMRAAEFALFETSPDKA